METVIEISGLQKSFGRAVALDGLDLRVAQGEVHGFLGPNGSGKSTTIRVLLGLIRADRGEVRILDRDPWSDAAEVHRRIAYVPGDVALWPNLTGGEAIDILTRLRGGVPGAERERLLEVFQLDPRKKVRAYSKGNRQKVALVAAFATPADLYILDEPTSGLDPLMEQVFREEVRRASAAGGTVLLSSHILGEVEQLCHRVTIVRLGRSVESGSLDAMRHLMRTEFSFVGGGALELPLTVHEVHRDGERTRFTVDSPDVPEVLAALARMRVTSLTVAPPSLEELFLRHYGGGDPAQAAGAHAA